MQEITECSKKLFEANFIQESTLVVISVVFGGLLTVIINSGAIKKQSKFDMQRKIIEEILQEAEKLQKEIEVLEIGISFNRIENDNYPNLVNSLARRCLSLNAMLQSKRKFVFRFIKAISVEKSVEMVSRLNKSMYVVGEGGFMDMKVKQPPDKVMIADLRSLTADAKTLSNALTESLEKLSAPGVIARIMRKLRPIWLFISENHAIMRVGSEKKDRNKWHEIPSLRWIIPFIIGVVFTIIVQLLLNLLNMNLI